MDTTTGPDLDAPARDDIKMVDVLQALADPVRLQLLRELKVLREAGVIEGRVEGTRRYYTIRRADLDARFPGLLDTVLRAEHDA